MSASEKLPELIVDSSWLREHRDDPGVVLVDTRAATDYWAGHLDGARHFDPFPFHHSDTSETGLIEFRAQLQWIFSALGITGAETVVFYENDSGMRAARGLWALDYMGHPRARMLDGGLGLLRSEKLVASAQPFAPSNFIGTSRDEVIAPYGYIADHLGAPQVQILDVRSAEEYYGERVRAKRGGAIPGAIHRDWVANLDARGAFKPAAQLREEFEAAGLRHATDVVAYCQGGYRAASSYVALKLAGYQSVRNYSASWGEWGNREDLPIEQPKRPH